MAPAVPHSVRRCAMCRLLCAQASALFAARSVWASLTMACKVSAVFCNAVSTVLWYCAVAWACAASAARCRAASAPPRRRGCSRSPPAAQDPLPLRSSRDRPSAELPSVAVNVKLGRRTCLPQRGLGPAVLAVRVAEFGRVQRGQRLAGPDRVAELVVQAHDAPGQRRRDPDQLLGRGLDDDRCGDALCEVLGCDRGHVQALAQRRGHGHGAAVALQQGGGVRQVGAVAPCGSPHAAGRAAHSRAGQGKGSAWECPGWAGRGPTEGGGAAGAAAGAWRRAPWRGVQVDVVQAAGRRTG